MAENQFQVGDVVTTKAGRHFSSTMVISRIEGEEYLCMWYNQTTHLFEYLALPGKILTKVS